MDESEDLEDEDCDEEEEEEEEEEEVKEVKDSDIEKFAGKSRRVAFGVARSAMVSSSGLRLQLQ